VNHHRVGSKPKYLKSSIYLGHGMEPLIFWTATIGGRGRMEQMFFPFLALILMGDWCGGVYTDTQK
jgi:hypothetical protein